MFEDVLDATFNFWTVCVVPCSPASDGCSHSSSGSRMSLGMRDSTACLDTLSQQHTPNIDMNSSTDLLSAMPTELLFRILCELNPHALARSRRVCRLFNNIVMQSAELQYKIELAIAGMENGPASRLTISDRRLRLREHQAAWRDLRWRSEKIIPMLRGGVWELYGGVLAQARGTNTLCFDQLPSETRGIPEKHWEVDVSIPIRDFGMDPSLDLLVVIQRPSEDDVYRINLLQLSTGKKHPDAREPTIVPHSQLTINCSFAIQISGAYLGVLFISGDGELSQLLIWNWKTAECELVLRGLETGSFNFLTERHILVAVANHAMMNPQLPHTEPALLVIDFLSTPNSPTNVQDVEFECAFHCPAMRRDAATLAISLRSDPSPIWSPNPDLEAPFHITRQDRLFVLTLWVVEGTNVSGLLIFIPSYTILAKLHSVSKEDRGVRFNWSDWGLEGTHVRLAPPGHSMVWVCYVYGMTFIAPFKPGAGPGVTLTQIPKMVQMFDFNQDAIRKQLQESEADGEATHIVTMPVRVNLDKVFTKPIMTTLPYRWRAKRVPYHDGRPFDSVLLSEDAIITVSSKPDIREYRVLSF